ncbi:HipA domain-containing protein [Ensifer sp. SSB1]
MIASGSSGLQGEWPKVALTMANDGLYYADAFVQDEEAVRHVIVKLLRSREERDRLILEAEAGYSVIARELGLKVHEPSTYTEGVLMIPRFDRKITDGATVRYGQESMVSAIGVAAYGRLANHEDYIDVLRKYSSDLYGDFAEYVKRDIANQAFGNPDNHGRNTAISKGPLGGVSIAPLYDFAPMRLAVEGISRSTRWAAMRDTHRDTAPDWAEVCRAVFPESLEIAERLLDEISDFCERLIGVVNRIYEFGIPQEVVDRAMQTRPPLPRALSARAGERPRRGYGEPDMPRWKKPTKEEISVLRARLREKAASGELRFPDGVVEIRKSLGLTQEQFATLTGVTKRQVAEIETGKANPTVETLQRIGSLFGFSVGFVPRGASESGGLKGPAPRM